MEWISVTERKPNVSRQFERFIVATDHGVGLAVFDNLDGFSSIVLNGSTQHSSLKVSHWMPLPEHPEE